MKRLKQGYNYIIRCEGAFEKHIYTDKLDADLAYDDYMQAGWFMISDTIFARRITDATNPVSNAPKRLDLPRYHSGSGFAQ